MYYLCGQVNTSNYYYIIPMVDLKKNCCCFFKKLLVFYNTLVLVAWLYVEALMAYHLYSQTRKGLKFDLGLLHKVDMWSFVGYAVKTATLLNSLNILYFLDLKSSKSLFLSELYHHLKGFLMYYVTFNLLKGNDNYRWATVNLSTWTLLNLMETLNRYNSFTENKNEFLEWVHYKLFMFLYPLQSVSEVLLLNSSLKFLKHCDKFKTFPSPMPNRYNFSFNLQILYKLLPLPMSVTSTVVYFKKFKYN